MDKTQAAELQDHLLDAARALDEARAIISTDAPDERAALSAPLEEVLDALHFKLLEALYVRYPDLPRPSEIPFIHTVRRWEDIALPEEVAEADLDSIIFSALKPQWRKTAMIIAMALKDCEKLALPVGAEVLGVRIKALADVDRIESRGDLRKWRHSEVRLKR